MKEYIDDFHVKSNCIANLSFKAESMRKTDYPGHSGWMSVGDLE